MAIVKPFTSRWKKHGKEISTGSFPVFEHDFPSDFVIVIDTREQDPLLLGRPPKGLVIVRDTLQYGDYSIRGFESAISVERKNVDDLWSSVTVDSERFKRELQALSSFERRWILIEGLESEYLDFNQHRKIHPNSIRWALASIEGRIGIPVHQSENRNFSERWLLDVFLKFFSHKRNPQ